MLCNQTVILNTSVNPSQVKLRCLNLSCGLLQGLPAQKMLVIIATSCEFINWMEEYSVVSYTSATLKFSLSGTRRQKLSKEGVKNMLLNKRI